MDVRKIRGDFPVLSRKFNGNPIIYLDNACTSLRPNSVIRSIGEYYSEYSACVGRSTHKLSTKATDKLEDARVKVAKFINAKKSNEIIWTKNTTESINLVARGLRLKKGDRVLTTNLEHSSGLLPWHEIVSTNGISIDFVTCSKTGEFDSEAFKEKMTKDTKIVSVILASNVTGTRAPIKEISKIAHDNGALVLADGAQSAPHMVTDVRKMDVDFFAFSGHKMCGPTGIGCLYGKEHLLNELSPLSIGGGTVTDVDLESHKLDALPYRLEGGIQDYSGAMGLAAAIDYLKNIGMPNIERYESELSKSLITGLLEVENLMLIGPKDWNTRSPLASFNIKNMEPHDVSGLLDDQNIAVRSGMHCAYPFHKYIGQNIGSVRASLYFYNTLEEINMLVERLKEIVSVLV